MRRGPILVWSDPDWRTRYISPSQLLVFKFGFGSPDLIIPIHDLLLPIALAVIG